MQKQSTSQNSHSCGGEATTPWIAWVRTVPLPIGPSLSYSNHRLLHLLSDELSRGCRRCWPGTCVSTTTSKFISLLLKNAHRAHTAIFFVIPCSTHRERNISIHTLYQIIKRKIHMRVCFTKSSTTTMNIDCSVMFTAFDWALAEGLFKRMPWSWPILGIAMAYSQRFHLYRE